MGGVQIRGAALLGCPDVGCYYGGVPKYEGMPLSGCPDVGFYYGVVPSYGAGRYWGAQMWGVPMGRCPNTRCCFVGLPRCGVTMWELIPILGANNGGGGVQMWGATV